MVGAEHLHFPEYPQVMLRWWSRESTLSESCIWSSCPSSSGSVEFKQLKVMRINHFYNGYHGNGLRFVPSGERVPGLTFCQLLIKNCHFSFLSYGPFALFQDTLLKHISHVKVLIETAMSLCFHPLLSNILFPYI